MRSPGSWAHRRRTNTVGSPCSLRRTRRPLALILLTLVVGTYLWLWTGRVSSLNAEVEARLELPTCSGEQPLSADEQVTVYTAATGTPSSCDLRATVWQPPDGDDYWAELRERPVTLPRILVPSLCDAVSAVAADDPDVEAYSSALDGHRCLAGVPAFSGCTDTIFESAAACHASSSPNRSVVTFGATALSVQRRYWGSWRPPAHTIVRGLGVASQPARLAGIRDAFVSLRATHGAGYAADLHSSYATDGLSAVVATCRAGIDEHACPWVKAELLLSGVRSWGASPFHFHLEVLPSLVPVLQQALEWDTRHVALHLAGTSKYVQRWLDLFGWSSRLQIHSSQSVFAEEAVLIDTAGGSPLADAPLLDNLRQAVFDAAFSGYPPIPTRTILMVRRSARGENGSRGADTIPFQSILDSLDAALSDGWTVEMFDDADDRLMSCIACQVHAFAKAAVVVGSVGAGMTNLLYSPPGAQVLLLNSAETHGLPPYLELAALRSLEVTVLPLLEPTQSVHVLVAHIVAAAAVADKRQIGDAGE